MNFFLLFLSAWLFSFNSLASSGRLSNIHVYTNTTPLELNPVSSSSTYQTAAIYWLPDYVKENSGYGYGNRINKNAPNTKNPSCAAYNLISASECEAPKTPQGSILTPKQGLKCYRGCSCPSEYQYTDDMCHDQYGPYFFAQEPKCDGKSKQCTMLTNCPEGYLKKMKECPDGYETDEAIYLQDRTSCWPQECHLYDCSKISGSTDPDSLTCSNGRIPTNTNIKSGDSYCYNCMCPPEYKYTRYNNQCQREHHGYSNWVVDLDSESCDNSWYKKCKCTPSVGKCTDYNLDDNNCTDGSIAHSCNDDCTTKYKCDCTPNTDCTAENGWLDIPPANALTVINCSKGCGDNNLRYKAQTCKDNYELNGSNCVLKQCPLPKLDYNQWCGIGLSCYVPKPNTGFCVSAPSCRDLGFLPIAEAQCGQSAYIKCPTDPSYVFCFKKKEKDIDCTSTCNFFFPSTFNKACINGCVENCNSGIPPETPYNNDAVASKKCNLFYNKNMANEHCEGTCRYIYNDEVCINECTSQCQTNYKIPLLYFISSGGTIIGCFTNKLDWNLYKSEL